MRNAKVYKLCIIWFYLASDALGAFFPPFSAATERQPRSLLPPSCSLASVCMSSSTNGEDEFIHHIAIQLSRAVNLVNPNDLLAKRVQDIAKNNSVEGFIEGAFLLSVLWLSAVVTCCLRSGKEFWQVQAFLPCRTPCRDLVAREAGGHWATATTSPRHCRPR